MKIIIEILLDILLFIILMWNLYGVIYLFWWIGHWFFPKKIHHHKWMYWNRYHKIWLNLESYVLTSTSTAPPPLTKRNCIICNKTESLTK